MLTRKQHELLMFIHERIKETGVSPSFDEMKEALDLASKSGIHRLITALEERGFLRRLPHRARALEVVKLPQQATTAAPPKGRQPFKPQLVDAGQGMTVAAAVGLCGISATNATIPIISSGAVSPIARETLRIAPVMMPGSASGNVC